MEFEASRAVIAKVSIEINDSAGKNFCIAGIWFSGHSAAKLCSHIYCVKEDHTCEHTQQDSRGIIQHYHYQRPGDSGKYDICARTGHVCSANGECDGNAVHHSIRVRYRTHAWISGGHKVNGKVAKRLETVCTQHHRCAMGAFSGDKSKCECMQL